MVQTDDETGGQGIVHLNANDAYDVYLSLPLRLVDEAEAFELAEETSES